jgi:quercetin dioxygenase-like cupin family protein
MKVFHERDMVKGWFVGNFSPAAFKLDACEVGLKRYKAGDQESAHVHKIATEITFVVEGKVKMNDTIFSKGSIVVIEPGEGCAFSVIEDAVTLVVKSPCALGDKYDLYIS